MMAFGSISGAMYSQLGQQADALEAYRQAIRIRPDSAMAWTALGIAYVKLGRHDDAIAAYR